MAKSNSSNAYGPVYADGRELVRQQLRLTESYDHKTKRPRNPRDIQIARLAAFNELQKIWPDQREALLRAAVHLDAPPKQEQKPDSFYKSA